MFCAIPGIVAVLGKLLGAVIAAAGGNIISSYLIDILKPSSPKLTFTIYEFEILITILCCILACLGIIKNYKKRPEVLIIPIFMLLLYVLLSYGFIMFIKNQVVAIGLCIILSGFYTIISYSIFRGNMKSRFLIPKEDKKG